MSMICHDKVYYCDKYDYQTVNGVNDYTPLAGAPISIDGAY